MTVQEYLNDPCGTSSLPYWKTIIYDIPKNIRIVHNGSFDITDYADYTDECYFKLVNYFDIDINCPLPKGYSITASSHDVFADHINSCYNDIKVSYEEVIGFTRRDVYDSELWISISSNETNNVVATGIAEFDRKVGEGVLEWIQVSESYRGIGLGKFVVSELLNRLKRKARFVTVSGKKGTVENPEILYRKCGFSGEDIWHILRSRDL